MSSFIPDTDNFFKYLLTVGVLMVLFGLIYPLKQEQELRTKLIDIVEQDSLLKVEVDYLGFQVDELDSLKYKTQLKIDRFKKEKIDASIPEQVVLDERIQTINDQFRNKVDAGLKVAKLLKLKKIKLIYDQRRHEETLKQIYEYYWFKMIFWCLGVVLMFAGLFFWMDSTYFDELVKLHTQPTLSSKYAQCITFLYNQNRILKWTLGVLIILTSLYYLISYLTRLW